jgi:hypothetical protein
MAFPVVPVLLLGAAALGGKYAYDKWFKKGLTTPVSELQQNKSYVVLAVVNPAPIGAEAAAQGKQIDKDQVAAMVKALFEQLGFVVLSQPNYRSPSEGLEFAAGRPTTFIFNARWTKAEKFIPAAIPEPWSKWFMGASFTPLPVA